MNTSGKGNAAENRVAADLERDRWVVGGRRHRPGGGDWLAVRFGGIDGTERPLWEIRLIEVKASSVRRGPWADFGPGDRAELAGTARSLRAEAWLAWTPTRGRILWIPADDWPS